MILADAPQAATDLTRVSPPFFSPLVGSGFEFGSAFARRTSEISHTFRARPLPFRIAGGNLIY
jgi:hypothetical protein